MGSEVISLKRTRTNWTKKATILLAAICVALAALTSFTPAGAQEWLLQVEGVPVSRAVYSYFLSQALPDAQLDADGRPKDMPALRRDVAARCVEYVAINSELRAMEIPVDQVLKAEVAERTAFLWRVFGRYYSSIGVDKQTLNAILTGQAARDQLFRALYGEGGTRPVPEAELDAYFYGNFVAYEGVRVFRTVLQEDGTEKPMEILQVEALRETLAEFVAEANEAEDFFGVAQDSRFAEALSYGMPSTTVVRKGAGDVSDADFEKIRGLAADKIELLDMPGVFLVARKVDMRKSPEEYYHGYRGVCLWARRGGDFAKALKELCAKFRADENVAAVERFYKEWAW